MSHHPNPLPGSLAEAPTNRYTSPPVRRRKYRPRRAADRWLSGAPAHVLDVFTNQHGYTVLYWFLGDGFVGGRTLNAQPEHPQFGVASSLEMEFPAAAAFRYRNRHKRMTWASLPEQVRRVVWRDAVTVI